MPVKREIFIYGAGSHAKVILDNLETGDRFKVAGIVDDTRREESPFPYPIFQSLDDLVSRGVRAGIVAVGDNWTRSRIVSRIKEEFADIEFISAIHPSAQIGRNVQIGPGTAVMAGVSINVDSRIGSHCIVNTSASLDHDNVLADFSSIGPGVVLGGNVHVGTLSAIALGAHVSNDLQIGCHTVVGVGSVVMGNIPDGVVAYGVPCKKVRSRDVDEPYLFSRK